MPDKLSVLVLGDIIGRSGLRAVIATLSTLKKRYHSDVIIVNGENSCDGFGINAQIVAQLLHAGVSVITTGNHVWHQNDIHELLDRENCLLRPDNYPSGLPGHGTISLELGKKLVCIINLQGRRYMQALDCPFQKLKTILKQHTQKIVIIDFHAEDTNEKEAMGFFAAQKGVSLLFGTHTHVQTADARIIKGSMGYITDVGACCAQEGIIGFEVDTTLQLIQTNVPSEFQVLDKPATICGLHADICMETGECSTIEAFNFQSSV